MMISSYIVLLLLSSLSSPSPQITCLFTLFLLLRDPEELYFKHLIDKYVKIVHNPNCSQNKPTTKLRQLALPLTSQAQFGQLEYR